MPWKRVFSLMVTLTKSEIERAEVSSTHSTEEAMETWQREGVDGCTRTDEAYLNHNDNSCPPLSAGVLARKVGWKPRTKWQDRLVVMDKPCKTDVIWVIAEPP